MVHAKDSLSGADGKKDVAIYLKEEWCDMVFDEDHSQQKTMEVRVWNWHHKGKVQVIRSGRHFISEDLVGRVQADMMWYSHIRSVMNTDDEISPDLIKFIRSYLMQK